MKKFLKFDLRLKKSPPSEKKPEMKGLLLQTYFTSLLCLVLCVTMFLGTTYAWFTSEVNNQANEIYVGTLKAELEKKDGDQWKSLSARQDGVNVTKLFDGDIRWEPGYTTRETIKVINKGDLAFKYVLGFTDGTALNPDATAAIPAEVAQYFEVWVYDYRANEGKEGVDPDPATYSDYGQEGSGWSYAGSLEGKNVLGGKLEIVDGVVAEHTYTIALHMKEGATADVMGKKLSLTVKLVAYQMVSEEDDVGAAYDQMVATQDELTAAVGNGGIVALATDIELTEALVIPAGKTVVLDLNGHTISQEKACTGSYNMINNRGTLTITGNGKLSFKDTGAGDTGTSWASYTLRNDGTLVVENGTIEHLGQQSGNMNNAIFSYCGSTTINDGVITAAYSRSVRIWMGSLTINGGQFDGQVWAQPQSESCQVTITGGSFKPGTHGNDGSSVYITNSAQDVIFSVTGGTFATKIGVADPDKLPGCITGGEFLNSAKADTNEKLFPTE